MIWEISLLIVSIAVLILVAFLVPAILQFRRSAMSLEAVTTKLDRDLPDILANLKEISINLSAMLATGRHHVESLGEAVGQVTGAVDDMVGFQKRVKRQLESPLLQSLNMVSAVAKAAHSFLTVFLSYKKRR
jgi:hypothetical protein